MTNLPNTMHGVQLTKHGDVDALRYTTIILRAVKVRPEKITYEASGLF